MGCSASVTPAMTIQSITKVDVATNTNDDEPRSNLIPTIEVVKHLIEVSTQTDDLQVDPKTNQTASSEEIDNKDLSLKYDPQKAFDNRNEPADWIDNYTNPRLNQNFDDREELEWILNDMDANQFCIMNQNLVMSCSQVTPTMVVDAMEKTNDLGSLPKGVWNLLNYARKTNDPTYLIRAYTAESNFYKILNRRLARQSLGNSSDITLEEQIQAMMGNVFTQLGQAVSNIQAIQAGQQAPLQNTNETDWAKLYLQAIYRLVLTPNSILRYQGPTYRGMRLTLDELDHYINKLYVCNKAITSTSKSRSIAQSFIDTGPRPENMCDVMFVYNVESLSAVMAIDVHTFSLIKDEEEVLLMPGILFTLGKPKITAPCSVEIEMRSAFQDLANGMFANSLTSLLSAFST